MVAFPYAGYKDGYSIWRLATLRSNICAIASRELIGTGCIVCFPKICWVITAKGFPCWPLFSDRNEEVDSSKLSPSDRGVYEFMGFPKWAH